MQHTSTDSTYTRLTVVVYNGHPHTGWAAYSELILKGILSVDLRDFQVERLKPFIHIVPDNGYVMDG